MPSRLIVRLLESGAAASSAASGMRSRVGRRDAPGHMTNLTNRNVA